MGTETGWPGGSEWWVRTTEVSRWEDLGEWHEVHDALGERYRERFTEEALAGLRPEWPLRFEVIRETWNEDTPDGVPERTIYEIRLFSG
jgi:hypothetical protein